MAGCPINRYLVGQLAWLDSHRLFWFTAHGDSAEDGHVLEFDELQCVAEQWICFYAGGQLLACLSAIRAAGVEDPDDYLIAWQLWHEVAPRRTKLIRSCLARWATDEDEPAPEKPRRPSRAPFVAIHPCT
ncbi:MAG: hypothetical protein Q7S40_12735 [Opitutaceae bacterium]|nr:hypothetical protein [Opitutaceae bacterium]